MTIAEYQIAGNQFLVIGAIVVVIAVLLALLLLLGNFAHSVQRKQRNRGITITRASRDNQELLNK